MKIVFTGGGTGGHFYPIIAVAEKVNEEISREKLIGAKLYYISNSPYDKEILFENGLVYEEVSAGKMRTYFSLLNVVDLFKALLGSINALYKMFTIYPDVVFGKGGYASFPTIFAAIVLRIPIFIHESDTAPGRVNKWAGKFAKRIAVSFREAAEYFPKDKVAWTGNPIRSEIERPADKKTALEYWKFETGIPVLLVLGGSQGAELINNTILDALPRLVKSYQIIHQTGIRNYKTVKAQSEVVLGGNEFKHRYTPVSFLNQLEIKMASGAATVIVSRAGSTIFEIASWGIPSILVPFTNSHSNHSKRNAFNYAHAGAASVVEEANMTANILSSEIDRLATDENLYKNMSTNAKAFNKPGAASTIAKELVHIALTHQK